ncbi:MAG: hypothetical protein C5B44_00360 [Acidobacteria bacterium]|nr:MAG: hypothetical protein C5B44_00360 [Acidobacteriota bacterium]
MKRSQVRAKFYVICVWCGITIREDKAEDSEGMCLRCFYKILAQRYQAQRRTRCAGRVSDR